MNASYRYRARTAAGDVVGGVMEAGSRDAVLAALRHRALYVTAVDRQSAVDAGVVRLFHVGAPKRRALLTFFRSLSTLVRVGIPLRRALEVTVERTRDGALREAQRALIADIEYGSPLSAAMARRPSAFAPLYVAMVQAGEAGGILDDVLDRLATMLEREADLRKKLRAALAYPAVVLGGALILVVFLLARVVPMFAEMFRSFNVPLPPITQLLIMTGTIAANPSAYAVAALVIACVVLSAVLAARTRGGAAALDVTRLRLPIVGPLLTKAITARIARMLATLLRSGIELVAAIEVIRPVAGSATFAAALERCNVALRAGEALTIPLARERVIDPLAVALVRVGEESGLLDEMLFKVAAYFETDVDAAIETLGATLEPVLLGFLGVIVGFIVFSVFIPLYSLIGSVSK